MLGAFIALLALKYMGINYWFALILVPLTVGLIGILMERFLIRPIANEDHLYSLLLTFGLALIIQGVFTHAFGSSGLSYAVPDALKGGTKAALSCTCLTTVLGSLLCQSLSVLAHGG